MSDSREHFGSGLRQAREDRALSLGDVASTTRVPRASLELIDAGALEGLPADVFVRGFIRSYARAVGVDEVAPLQGYDRALRARNEAARVQSSLPVVDPTMAGLPAADVADEVEVEEASSSRRGLGLAVFVIVLLLIATITLSLLLRRPPPSGEGLSLRSRGGASSPVSPLADV
ncbi:MAG TPA: helix-turn-helix domain-containing protein [Polyangia bacterium]|nr:helix-turn-helix domain-containing protein [Polyangia bacterium]